MPYLDPPVSWCSVLRYLGYQEIDGDLTGTYRHLWVVPSQALRHRVLPVDCPPRLDEPQAQEPPMSKQPQPAAPVVPAVAPAAPTSDLASLLHAACARKASDAASPSLRAVETLQADLLLFSAAVQKRAEEEAMSAMLHAVGATAPTPKDIAPVEARLRTSLAALLELVGGPFDTEVAQEPAPSGIIEAPPPAPESGPIFDEEEVRAVLGRVDALGGHKWAEQEKIRLFSVIQGLTAEVRYWQQHVTTSSHLHWQLGQSVKMLAAIKYESKIEEFVRGLAQSQTGDWLRIARDANNAVWKFDQDAKKALKKAAQPPPSAKTPKVEEEERTFSWPALPALRDCTKTHPLVLVGGIAVPNKIASIHERFGFEVEWVEVYRNKGDGASVARVSNGTVGAVIILEKFLGHRTSEKLVEVCKAMDIPWAYGGNAGLATLQRAMVQINTKVA